MNGVVYSLSPDLDLPGDCMENPNLVSQETYEKLLEEQVMFPDQRKDRFMVSAGMASDWPYGRSMWCSGDKECIVWFGEEDHVRIMVTRKGTRLNECFERLKKLLDAVEGVEGVSYARSARYGFVTSCPSNLGTGGLRASVRFHAPRLARGGSESRVQKLCAPLGLGVRFFRGGAVRVDESDGVVDLSSMPSCFVTERDLVNNLHTGIREIANAERSMDR